MMAMFDGAEGSPFESIAQMATRSVTLAGSEPPVEDCEIDPIPGAPAPVALNSFTGSFPVTSRLASALPSAMVVYVLVRVEVPLAGEQRVARRRLHLVGRPRRPERDRVEQRRAAARAPRPSAWARRPGRTSTSVTVCPSICTDQSFFRLHRCIRKDIVMTWNGTPLPFAGRPAPYWQPSGSSCWRLPSRLARWRSPQH